MIEVCGVMRAAPQNRSDGSVNGVRFVNTKVKYVAFCVKS